LGGFFKSTKLTINAGLGGERKRSHRAKKRKGRVQTGGAYNPVGGCSSHKGGNEKETMVTDMTGTKGGTANQGGPAKMDAWLRGGGRHEAGNKTKAFSLREKNSSFPKKGRPKGAEIVKGERRAERVRKRHYN